MMLRVVSVVGSFHGGAVVAVTEAAPGSLIGSQTWSGTDWPAQCAPHTRTQPASSATDVVADS